MNPRVKNIVSDPRKGGGCGKRGGGFNFSMDDLGDDDDFGGMGGFGGFPGMHRQRSRYPKIYLPKFSEVLNAVAISSFLPYSPFDRTARLQPIS